MGLAAVPIARVPPAFTDILPPTTVKELFTVELNLSVPLIVVVLAVALDMSTVTVAPERIVRVLQATGTMAGLHVEGEPQLPPAPTLVAPRQKFQFELSPASVELVVKIV